MSNIAFGTGGFRGIIGDDFTKENVQLIAQGLANLIHINLEEDKPIIVGYDNRFMSDYAAKWFIEVLNGNGIESYIFTYPVPTPVIMSATRDRGYYYGVMITASHNPYYFNGIKIFTKEGYDADVSFTSSLEEAIKNVLIINTLEERKAREKGLLSDYTNLHSYIAHIKSFVDPNIDGEHLRVLYNNMNGVGAIGFYAIAREMKIKEFVTINDTHDAFFGFNLPNPTKEALTGHFAQMVVEGKYDLGLASDSDGDRLGIIDEKGNYVSANEILACIYYHLVVNRGYKGDIVKNLATSTFINKTAEYLGFKSHEVDVGFKNITHGMKKYNALLGGESSGGLTMQGYIYGKDASFAASLFLEMVIKANKPVSEIVREIKEKVGYSKYFHEDFIPLRADVKRVIEEISNNPPIFNKEVVKKDYYGRNFKYCFDNDSWLLIRLSGTEPAFRLFAEFDSEEETKKNAEILKNYIYEIQNKLDK